MTDFLGLRYANPISISSEVVEHLSRSRDGTLIGTREGYARWIVSVGIEPQKYGATGLLAHRMKHASTIPFRMKMPQTIETGDFQTLDIQSASPIGSDKVTVTISALIDTVIGRFISFSNHAKVYVVSSSNGPILTIQPNLQIDISTSETINTNPYLTCRYLEDSGGFYELDSRSILSTRISVIET